MTVTVCELEAMAIEIEIVDLPDLPIENSDFP
jgi:hypothetical protein